MQKAAYPKKGSGHNIPVLLQLCLNLATSLSTRCDTTFGRCRRLAPADSEFMWNTIKLCLKAGADHFLLLLRNIYTSLATIDVITSKGGDAILLDTSMHMREVGIMGKDGIAYKFFMFYVLSEWGLLVAAHAVPSVAFVRLHLLILAEVSEHDTQHNATDETPEQLYALSSLPLLTRAFRCSYMQEERNAKTAARAPLLRSYYYPKTRATRCRDRDYDSFTNPRPRICPGREVCAAQVVAQAGERTTRRKACSSQTATLLKEACRRQQHLAQLVFMHVLEGLFSATSDDTDHRDTSRRRSCRSP